MVPISNDLDPLSKGARNNQRDLCEIYWKEEKNVCENCQAADVTGGRNVSRYYLFFSFIKPISLLSGLDSAADFQLGYFPCQLLTPMSASFCPNDEGEDEYETFDEEEEDESEKPEEL